jgi:predicted metal-binding protein
MVAHPSVESILDRRRFNDYRWLDPTGIRVAEWVRMKCSFGCPHFDRAAVCPPNTPGVEECRLFFAEYRRAVLLHFQNAGSEARARHTWSAQTNRSLVDLEREVFLAGYPKAFALFTDSCHLCEACVPRKADCREPLLARPSATALAVDVFGTARQAGYSIEVLTEPSAPVDYFAFLMVD